MNTVHQFPYSILSKENTCACIFPLYLFFTGSPTTHSCIWHWYVEAEQRGVSADKERKNYHTAHVLLGKKIRRIPILSEDSCCGFLFSHKYICLHWLAGDGLLLQRRLKFTSNLIFNSRLSMALVVIQCLGRGYNFMRLTKSLFLMQTITTVQNSLGCKCKSSKWCRIF